MTISTIDNNPATYPVMEQFYTLQGEGFHQGKAAYFIRLAGCDVGCVWCDVKESWDRSKHKELTITDIITPLLETPAEIVVITGGEPFIYDLTPLVDILHKEGLKVHIETSGAYPVSGKADWICVSPKKFKAPLESVLQKADELKVIVYHRSDFMWAEAHAAKVNASCHLYLQPEWEKRHEMTPLIVGYIKEQPSWKCSLQVHKYMDIP